MSNVTSSLRKIKITMYSKTYNMFHSLYNQPSGILAPDYHSSTSNLKYKKMKINIKKIQKNSKKNKKNQKNHKKMVCGLH